MDAAFRRDGRHVRAQVDPELRIALAETDRRRTRDQARQTERRQRPFIKTPGAFQVAYADGNVVDYLRCIRVAVKRVAREESGPILTRHSGATRSVEPGISRFRIWSCGPFRND